MSKYPLIFTLVCLTAMGASSIAIAAAEKIEVPYSEPSKAVFPQNLDILGTRTGMTYQEINRILSEKGFKESTVGGFKSNILCNNLGNCLSYKGDTKYVKNATWISDGEEIEVQFNPPFQGNIAYGIYRTVKYDGRDMPTFDIARTSAENKYGKKRQYREPGGGFGGPSIACWAIKNGGFLEPHKKSLQCTSSDFTSVEKEVEGYVFLEHHINRTRFIRYSLVDKKLLRNARPGVLRKLFDDGMSQIEGARTKKAMSGVAPEL